MIKFLGNPVEMVLRVCSQLYPALDVAITLEMADKLDGKACAVFPENELPYILIAHDCPICHMAEMIAHEIAHVVAGQDAGHGEVWESEFERIQKAYETQMGSLEGGELVKV